MPKNTTLIKVTNQEFLEALFGEDWVNVPVSSGKGWAVKSAGTALKWLKPEKANYFCVSTFSPADDGKFVRQKQYFRRQHVFVVDDIGTKLKLSVAIDLFPLPTYIIETSPGNFQWGFKLTDGTDPRALSSLVDAVVGNAELNPSLRDPGMAGVTRVARPAVGSNVKPTVIEANGGKPFLSVMHSWRPERAYSVAEIAEHIGADLSETRLARYTAGMFATNTATPEQIAGDTVLKVFDAKGMIIDTDPNDSGFINVVCPWNHEHTDDRVEAGYKIGGGFQCHHGHCQHRTMDDVKKWIAEECREEHTAAIAEVFAAEPIDMERLARLQEREEIAEERRAEIVQQAEMTFRERYVYIKSGEGLIGDRIDRIVISKSVFNDTTQQYLPRGMKKAPSVYLANMGEEFHVRGVGFYPGKGSVVREEGEGKPHQVFNVWTPHPIGPWALDTPSDDDIRPWLNLCEHIFPDVQIRAIFFDWCAHLMQRPGVKVNWAWMLVGDQGVGKSLLLRPFNFILGKNNARMLSPADLEDSFQPWAESELLIVEELPPFHKRDLYERLKALVSVSQEVIWINKKFKDPYPVSNKHLWFFFSNNDNALALDGDDRRYLVYRTPAKKGPAELYDSVAAMLESRIALQKIRGWLEARDISKFDPFAAPPVTDAKLDMIEQARDDADVWIEAQFAEGGAFEGREIPCVYELTTAVRIDGELPEDAKKRVTPKKIAAALRKHGYASLGRRRVGNDQYSYWAKSKVAVLLKQVSKQTFEMKYKADKDAWIERQKAREAAAAAKTAGGVAKSRS